MNNQFFGPSDNSFAAMGQKQLSVEKGMSPLKAMQAGGPGSGPKAGFASRDKVIAELKRQGFKADPGNATHNAPDNRMKHFSKRSTHQSNGAGENKKNITHHVAVHPDGSWEHTSEASHDGCNVKDLKHIAKNLAAQKVLLTKGTGHLELREFMARSFSDTKRKTLAKKGAALPDGSFPIVTAKDLANSIRDVGRAKDASKAKAHIISRAKVLGLTASLPDGWTKKSVSANKKAIANPMKKGKQIGSPGTTSNRFDIAQVSTSALRAGGPGSGRHKQMVKEAEKAGFSKMGSGNGGSRTFVMHNGKNEYMLLGKDGKNWQHINDNRSTEHKDWVTRGKSVDSFKEHLSNRKGKDVSTSAAKKKTIGSSPSNIGKKSNVGKLTSYDLEVDED